MIEGLQLNIPQRLNLLKTCLVFSILFCTFFSLNLWTGWSDFPVVPVWDELWCAPSLHTIVYLVFVLTLLASWLSKFQRTFLALSILLSIFTVLLDVNRLQPWFYIFTSMQIIVLFYNGRVDNPNTYTSFFVVLQMVLASVYFFSGLNMLNPNFVEGAFRDMVLPLKSLMSMRQFNFVVSTGKAVPYLFILSSVILLTETLRFLGVAVLAIIHAAIFILMFPGFDGKAYSLWFSNLGFICILFLLFSGPIKQRYFSPLSLLQRPAFYPILLAFLIMPFFNRNGWWPDYLSNNIKTGNTLMVKVSLSEKAYTALAPSIKKFCHRGNYNYNLDYTAWSEEELQAPCFPHKLVFNKISDRLLSSTGMSSDEINLVLLPRNKFLFKR